MKGGLTGIWDSHVHGYPKDVSRAASSWGLARGETHWLELVTEGPQGWADAEELLREMDRCGVERSLLLGWYWERAETCREQNGWYQRWVTAWPDRFSAFLSMHADMLEPEAELERGRDWGALGVGELLPEVQSEGGWSDKGWERIIQWTSEAGWPINLHVTEPAGHRYPGRIATPLDRLTDIFETYPDQVWILAHWGGGLPFYSLNRRVAKALKNCYYDTAATPLLYSKRIWRTVIDLVGAERILFGSDYPLRVYPRKQAEAEMHSFLESFAMTELSDLERDQIGSGNLKRVLGFSG